MSDLELESERLKAIFRTYTKILGREKGSRIVIFSKYLKFLDLVDEILRRQANIIPLRLNGTTNQQQRLQTINAFAESNGKVLLITSTTGGAGMNGLECASNLIQCKPRWTKAEQMQARIHIFGIANNW